jgi:peptidoglycan/xylan/chitin deacetylase (PgdA/CDA1 family)
MMTPYSADRSLYGKLRRRLARVVATSPAVVELRRPMLTISFDDAPVSAVTGGAQILERHNVRGTYFISTGLCGKDSHLGRYATLDEVCALAKAEHEIACHTQSHLDCGRAEPADIAAELDANAQALASIDIVPETFAYPYGDVSPRAKALFKRRFSAARALHHGLIATGSDLNQAPAVGIEGAQGEHTALEWMRRAAERKAWLVLYTHDVRDTPSDWGCTPAVLERIVKAGEDMGFAFVTFAEGARRIGVNTQVIAA